MGKFGGFGAADGELNYPWGIAVDDEGFIYIGDWRNDRIQKFDASGRFVWKFGASGSRDGELSRPAGVAVDRHGDIYVADWGNNRIQLFSKEGRFIQKFTGDGTMSRATLARMWTRPARYKRMRESGSLEMEKLFGRPRSVRVDDEGHMYVPDYECHRLQVYKKEAYPLTPDNVLPPFRSSVMDYF